jgi:hypothetical protein
LCAGGDRCVFLAVCVCARDSNTLIMITKNSSNCYEDSPLCCNVLEPYRSRRVHHTYRLYRKSRDPGCWVLLGFYGVQLG